MVKKTLLYNIVAIALGACTSSSVTPQPESKPEATLADSISVAIDSQLIHYPTSQYRDVYKNFMQDFLSPNT